ncbi:MAG: IS5/IS1182 family transposase, partial [Bacteroidales bacterium]|nr:IS5/IS1182 family transposase [Bacteroidales bacterium]
IGHLKKDCRMEINYLKGIIGNEINANLAAAGFNFGGLLRKIKEEILWLRFYIQIFSTNKKYFHSLGLLRID